MSQAADYIPRKAMVQLLCTPPLSAPTHIPCRMTRNSTRQATESAREAERDPLVLFPAFLISNGVIDEAGLDRVRREVEREVAETADSALKEPQPSRGTSPYYLYSEDVDPTSGHFESEAHFLASRALWSIPSIRRLPKKCAVTPVIVFW